MHKTIYAAFERICRERNAGGAVLEIGARPSAKTLLAMESLAQAREKIGINLTAPARFGDFEILQCDANNMSIFPDERFDTVLCNAMLEHDKFFWKTIAEIHRVTKRGGVIVIGVPGYAELPLNRIFHRKGRGRERFGWLFQSTLTFRVHNAPGDYFRFSEQTMREIFLAGLGDVRTEVLMIPPRIIGSGIKS